MRVKKLVGDWIDALGRLATYEKIGERSLHAHRGDVGRR